MLQTDIIEPKVNPWASPFVLVNLLNSAYISAYIPYHVNDDEYTRPARVAKHSQDELTRPPRSTEDGSTQFCIDNRKLNAVTKKDSYPILHIQELLDLLGQTQYFTTLDLFSGY